MAALVQSGPPSALGNHRVSCMTLLMPVHLACRRLERARPSASTEPVGSTVAWICCARPASSPSARARISRKIRSVGEGGSTISAAGLEKAKAMGWSPDQWLTASDFECGVQEEDLEELMPPEYCSAPGGTAGTNASNLDSEPGSSRHSCTSDPVNSQSFRARVAACRRRMCY